MSHWRSRLLKQSKKYHQRKCCAIDKTRWTWHRSKLSFLGDQRKNLQRGSLWDAIARQAGNWKTSRTRSCLLLVVLSGLFSKNKEQLRLQPSANQSEHEMCFPEFQCTKSQFVNEFTCVTFSTGGRLVFRSTEHFCRKEENWVFVGECHFRHPHVMFCSDRTGVNTYQKQQRKSIKGEHKRCLQHKGETQSIRIQATIYNCATSTVYRHQFPRNFCHQLFSCNCG